jgi:hypothetical protein
MITGGQYNKLIKKYMPPPIYGKGKKQPSAWNNHVAKVRKENPNLSFKQAIEKAKKSYNKGGVLIGGKKGRPKKAAPKKAAPKKAAKKQMSKDELRMLLMGL